MAEAGRFLAAPGIIGARKFLIYKEFVLQTGALCCVRLQTC
jgi:hypothetical protein